jgi:superfamily II DNA or RNA helicase
MGLRAPQVAALKEFRDALLRLPAPLQACSPEQRREFLALREGWRHPFHPTFTVAIATGVGKTRLAGALIALLWLANEARTFLILAPRRAVLRRFESALDHRFREYIFVDPQLVPEPSIVRADEIDSPRSFEFEGDMFSRGPKIFLLSPQLIASSDRFSRRPEFAERSPMEALKARQDLVIIADEAHHIGKVSSRETTAWASAVRRLEPAVQVGLTATPRREPGEHLLYEYPLQTALRDGLYTKSVHICVRQFGDSTLDADDIDKSAIIYSVDRLDRKQEAIDKSVAAGSFAPTKAVCVFFARDIEHATQVKEWVIATGRVSGEQVLLTHSGMSKSEEEIERLLSIESLENPVRVVVNVMELTEGWDVTNVYVVTPLRAMATFQGALQAMGRGLRLPVGRRVDDPVLDELDVVCFGREALEKIVRESTDWIGTHGAGGGVKVTNFDKSDPAVSTIYVGAKHLYSFEHSRYQYVEDDLKLELDKAALAKVREAVVTEVQLAEAQTRLGYGRSRIERERFVEATSYRIIRRLNRYLSDARDFKAVSDLVRKWIDAVRPDSKTVDFDPAEVSEEIARALQAGAKVKPARYEVLDGKEICAFPGYIGKQEVVIGPGEGIPEITIDQLPVFDGTAFVRGQMYRGWQKAIHTAYSFDSEPEARLALLLDRAPEVGWWVRNVPAQFKLDTTSGQFRPDFIVSSTGDKPTIIILEAKGDHMWVDPSHDSRLKSAAAKEWAAAQRSAGVQIEAVVALQSDIERCSSWGELVKSLQ